MVRKISFMILSVAILVTGVTGYNKLAYWEKSVRIFRIDPEVSPQGRMGRDHRGGESERRGEPGGRGEFSRPDNRELPDSIRVRFGSGEGRPGHERRERSIPDSLRQQFGSGESGRIGRGAYRGDIRFGGGRGGHDFQGGKKINLRNVLWFLAVFSSFTVVAIYINNLYCLFRKRKTGKLSRPVFRETK